MRFNCVDAEKLSQLKGVSETQQALYQRLVGKDIPMGMFYELNDLAKTGTMVDVDEYLVRHNAMSWFR